MLNAPYINPADAASFEACVLLASKIGIVTHTRPDGDAIGSALAMKRFLEARLGASGKCSLFLDTAAPGQVLFLFTPAELRETFVCARDPEGAAASAAGCDLLVFLDLNTLSRTGALESLFHKSEARKILVDHHLGPERASFDLIFSETGVSSTCELLYLLLSRFPCSAGKGLPQECLDPLLTGITTDTNNFANSVSGTTLSVVSELLDGGARRERILEEVFNRYPERRIRLMGRLLDRGLTVTEKGAAVMVLDGKTAAEFGILDGETEGFVNIPLAIDNVKMSLFLKQEGEKYRVSIRSKKDWSANRLAVRYFAGGGHEQASGGQLIPEPGSGVEDVVALACRFTDEFIAHEEN